MAENFLFEHDGAITTITFNRPERLNCMNHEVIHDLEELVLRVRDDGETRVLIVTGNGRAFSAGADVSAGKGIADPRERNRLFAERNKGLPRVIGRIFDTLLRLDALTIGAINGFAVGGGWALAAGMDFVVAAETAEFWVPEVELGVAFVGGPAEVIARRVGPWRAKEIMVACRHYSAQELFTMGMVNKVVAPEDLMTTTHGLAQSLLKLPRKAVTRTKHAIDGVFIGPRLY